MAAPPREVQPGAPRALGRTLARRHIALIALGGVIGAGLFVGSSVAINAAGPAITVSYLLAGLVVLAVMMMIGELSQEHPSAQGFTELIRVQGGPGLGFVIAWLYWYAWVMTIAIEAVAAANILEPWFPIPVWQLSVGLILAITGLNLLSTRSFGEFEFWLSSVKVVAVGAIILAALTFSVGLWGAHQSTWSNLFDHGGFMPRGIRSIFTGVVAVFFSMCGAEVTTIASVEAREGAGSGTRMAVTLMVRLTAFYVVSMLLIIVVVPWTSIIPGISPFITALETMGLRQAGTLMGAVVLTAILSNLNTSLYVSSRVLYTLAGHAEAPRRLGQLNARRVPDRAVLLGCASGLGCLVISFTSAQSAFVFLVNGIGAVSLFIYTTVCITHLQMRYQVKRRTGTRTPGIPLWVDYAAILAMGSFLLVMALNSGLISPLSIDAIPVGAVIAAYLYVRRRRERHPSVSESQEPVDAV